MVSQSYFLNVYNFNLLFGSFSVNQVAPKVRKVLQLFRLKQINNGVFVKLNKVNNLYLYYTLFLLEKAVSILLFTSNLSKDFKMVVLETLIPNKPMFLEP